jgi:hypothetical protein
MIKIEPIKELVFQCLANDIYNELVSIVPHERPKDIGFYGASQSDLIKIMCLTINNSRRHTFNILPQELQDGYSIDIGERYLEKLAFLCKEDFYGFPNEKRRTSIVVKGGDETKREIFRNKLTSVVDVFVHDGKNYPEINKEYVIDLNNYV